jgi:hypothetical protein
LGKLGKIKDARNEITLQKQMAIMALPRQVLLEESFANETA